MLTEDQQLLKDQVITFAISRAKEYVICAGGGCGKTYFMANINNDQHDWYSRTGIMGDEYTLTFTATTNEATQVMSKMGLNAKTIFKLCGLRPSFSGQLVAKTKPIQDKLLVFIDESSYINPNTRELILQQLPNSKIVWVLDDAQLSPVGYELPVVNNMGFKQSQLTKVLRSEGKLQELNLYLRQCVLNQVNPMFDTWEGEDILLVNGSEYQQLVSQYFNSDWNPSKARMLSYHRERTKAYNGYVHTEVFGYDSYYAIGSTLRQQGYSTAIHDGATIVIESVEKTYTKVNGKDFGCTIINNEYLIIDEPKQFQKHCRDNKNWDMINAPTNLQHTYANTIHVAQGSTIETVFIDLTDVRHAYNNSREMYRRLVYSGISRASKRVIIRYE